MKKSFLQSTSAASTLVLLRRSSSDQQGMEKNLPRWATSLCSPWFPNSPSMEWQEGRQREGKGWSWTHSWKWAQSSTGSSRQRTNPSQSISREGEHISGSWPGCSSAGHGLLTRRELVPAHGCVTLQRPSVPVKQHSWLGQGGFAPQSPTCCLCCPKFVPCCSSASPQHHPQLRVTQSPARFCTNTLWAPHSPTPSMGTGLVCPKTAAEHRKLK